MGGVVLFVHGMYAHKRPAFEAARELGLSIAVVGPDLPGWAAPLVDEFVPGATESAQAMRTTIEQLQARHAARPYAGVVTFWDHGVVPVAQIATALGLPGSSPQAAHQVRNKYAMRLALGRHGVPQPPFALVRNWPELEAAARRIGFPAVYKPAGGAGSAGVFPVRSATDLHRVFETRTKHLTPNNDSFFGYYPGEFVYERFVPGREVSVEGVVADGVLHTAGVTEKWTTPDTFTEFQHAYPARLASEQEKTARQLAQAAVHAIGIDYCGVHAEVMLTDDGGQVIEVNGRLGGDFITSHLVPLAEGTDLLQAAIKAATGRPVHLTATRREAACVRFLLADRRGVVARWRGLEDARAAPGVQEVTVTRQVGDPVELPPEAFFASRLGFVVTHGRDTGEAVELAGRGLSAVKCDVV
jgi:biotin carboxylase